MNNNARRYVGAVPGGRPTRQIPTSIYNQDECVPHVNGRLDAMSEMLLHVAFVKSAGIVSPSTRLSYSGAQFQDFKGSKKGSIVMAHRSIMGIKVDERRNIADVVGLRSRLRTLLIAPQARTDPLVPGANYADRLLEIAAAPPLLKVFQTVFDKQPANGSVEEGRIVDASYLLKECLAECYLKAIDRHEDIKKSLGWIEFKPGDPWPDAKQQQGTISVNALRHQLIREGPGDSEWVNERFTPENLKFLFDGSQKATDYPQLYLAVSRDWSERFVPSMVNRDEIEKAYDKLEEAKAASPSTSVYR